MGKKYRNLFENISDINNLRDAYKKVIKNGNRYKTEHLVFKENLEVNLYELQQELKTETYQVGKIHNFVVYEPKERFITALPFRDKIVQHAINNIIEPIFEKTFYPTSYACRKNKGTHKGVNNVQATIRRYKKQHKECYFLKTDFSKYFHSIYSKLLKEKISKKITDRKTLRLIFKFIDEKGLKIGFLTSQLFANINGHILDTFVKTKLHIKHYFRYMDDTVLISTSKEKLKNIQKILERFSGIFMKLKFSKWFIQKVDVQFINFLGYRIKSDYKLIRKDSVIRAKRKIKRFTKLRLFDDLQKFLASWLGHVRKANSFNLVNLFKKELVYARS
ncbi:reverse transcriptase/maturase family protein [Aliarcobacter butzleri]|uniref:reverse transcriptase/maturase family protein n=1 Tax=Aliarcobacter butzleri TaxID=28197 RepID=UPI0021B6145F|nr:reverse transcriptase/maturase family protein [Aliarcobacter butzleri]MCT7643839.1 reverse transcriptase/maturase family protein [Aliarcobacter butzleri]